MRRESRLRLRLIFLGIILAILLTLTGTIVLKGRMARLPVGTIGAVLSSVPDPARSVVRAMTRAEGRCSAGSRGLGASEESPLPAASPARNAESVGSGQCCSRCEGALLPPGGRPYGTMPAEE